MSKAADKSTITKRSKNESTAPTTTDNTDQSPPTPTPNSITQAGNDGIDHNTPFEHFIAMITLGLFFGWYHIVILIIYPSVALGIFYYHSPLAMAIAVLLITLIFIPLDHQPQKWFTSSWIFRIWKNSFRFTYDVSAANTANGQLCLFADFPHGVFPMGQFLCASIMNDVCIDGNVVCGTGANVVFCFPVMRHILSWIGTRPATTAGIRAILRDGHNVSIIPGGIAEMYLINKKDESIYLRKRHKMIRLAIQEGLDIIPSYTFGNTRMFDIVIGRKEEEDASRGGNHKEESSPSSGSSGSSSSRGTSSSSSSSADRSFISLLSRRLRMSILFFYGRGYTTIPYQVPLRVVRGRKICVTQEAQPSDATVQRVLDEVVKEVQHIYQTKRPEWEDRPLVVY